MISRYVRIIPRSWHGHIALRAGFYGCESGKFFFSTYEILLFNVESFSLKKVPEIHEGDCAIKEISLIVPHYR